MISHKSHVVGDGLITQAIALDVVSLDRCKKVHQRGLDRYSIKASDQGERGLFEAAHEQQAEDP